MAKKAELSDIQISNMVDTLYQLRLLFHENDYSELAYDTNLLKKALEGKYVSYDTDEYTEPEAYREEVISAFKNTVEKALKSGRTAEIGTWIQEMFYDNSEDMANKVFEEYARLCSLYVKKPFSGMFYYPNYRSMDGFEIFLGNSSEEQIKEHFGEAYPAYIFLSRLVKIKREVEDYLDNSLFSRPENSRRSLCWESTVSFIQGFVREFTFFCHPLQLGEIYEITQKYKEQCEGTEVKFYGGWTTISEDEHNGERNESLVIMSQPTGDSVYLLDKPEKCFPVNRVVMFEPDDNCYKIEIAGCLSECGWNSRLQLFRYQDIGRSNPNVGYRRDVDWSVNKIQYLLNVQFLFNVDVRDFLNEKGYGLIEGNGDLSNSFRNFMSR